jgi:periplasmic protein TonB
VKWLMAVAGFGLTVGAGLAVIRTPAEGTGERSLRRVMRASSSLPRERALRLVLKSLPSGASAWVEGTYAGETPLEVDVEAGADSVAVELELPDFAPLSVRTELRKARVVLVQRLAPAVGWAPSARFLARRALPMTLTTVATVAVAPLERALDAGPPTVSPPRLALRSPPQPAQHLVAKAAVRTRAPTSVNPTGSLTEQLALAPPVPQVGLGAQEAKAAASSPSAPPPSTAPLASALALSREDDLEEAEPPVPEGSNKPPDYPEAARSLAVEARTTLRVMVDAHGAIASVTPLKGEEPFVSAAIAAVKGWRYQPAMLRGQPITYRMVVTVRFQLNRVSNFE